MSKYAHNRDGALNSQERIDSARKCLDIIEDYLDKLRPNERRFVEDMGHKLDETGCSEPQLQWLRDIKDRVI